MTRTVALLGEVVGCTLYDLISLSLSWHVLLLSLVYPCCNTKMAYFKQFVTFFSIADSYDCIQVSVGYIIIHVIRKFCSSSVHSIILLISLHFPELSVATRSKFYCYWIIKNQFISTASIRRYSERSEVEKRLRKSDL